MAQTATPEGPRPSHMYKVVLLGSMSVGKSSLAYRYVKNDFRELLPTVGCSFFTQKLELDEATVKFEIWDTAGQEKYQSVCHLYYRDAHAALLVYDIANKEGEDFARTKGLLFMETSAKSNHQVNDVFMAVVQELLRREKEKAPRPSPRGNSTVDLRASGARTRCCRS